MNPREASEYRPDFIQILIKWLHGNESSRTIYVRTYLAYNLRKILIFNLGLKKQCVH